MLPIFTFECPDCGQPISLPTERATIRRMGDLVSVPVLIRDSAWQATMDAHIAEAGQDHPPFVPLG